MEDKTKSFDGKRKKQMTRQKQAVTGRRTKKIGPERSKGGDAGPFMDDGVETSANTATSMDPELYTAALEGNILELVRAMEKGPADRQLDFPADCVQVSPQKNTALHIATSFRHYEIANLICKDLPFYVGEKNLKGDTALHIAARLGDSFLVSLLVDAMKESDINTILGEKNGEGNTALHEALLHRHEKVAGTLINKNQDLPYSVNEEGMSVLYLAAEAGYTELVRMIMENPVGNENNGDGRLRKKSPVHAAIHGRNLDVLIILWEKDQSSFHSRCEQGRNPLHHAASIGYPEGVNFLLEKICGAAYQSDKNGQFPIHIASAKGRVDIIQDFLDHCPDSMELLNLQGQTMLHAAAQAGKTKAVQFMLRTSWIGKILNERDNDGNTPLHLATINLHPKVVNTLARDGRVNLVLKNKEGLAPYDIANGCHANMDKMSTSFSKRLTWLALRFACAKRSHPVAFRNKRQNQMQGGTLKLESYRDHVTAVLLISSVIASLTFSAAFTVPGGDNNSNPNQGTATMVTEKMFHAFVISNSMAMYTSILVSITLILVQIGDLGLVPFALKLALPLLCLALTMMLIAFTAGLYLVVCKLPWLGDVVLLMGLPFLVILVLSSLFLIFCFLGSPNYLVSRYIAYYPFSLILFTFGSHDNDEYADQTSSWT